MALVDVEKIINGTADKRIINGYNKLKSDYTKESAEEFKEIYSKESFGSIINNSQLIFSEAYYGSDYFESMLENNVGFKDLPDRLKFMKESTSRANGKASDGQIAKYNEAINKLSSYMKESKGLQIMSKFIHDNINPMMEDSLAEFISTESGELVEEMFALCDEPTEFFTFLPFAESFINPYLLNDWMKYYVEACDPTLSDGSDIEERFTNLVDVVTTCNKLYQDKVYREAVNSMAHKASRDAIKTFANISLESYLDEVTSELVKNEDYIHLTAESAVNSLFNDIDSNSLEKELYKDERQMMNKIKNYAYERVMDLILIEYAMDKDLTADAKGYTVVSEGTLEDMYSRLYKLYSEASEDEEMDVDKELAGMEEEPVDTSVQNTGKKPNAPKPKNLATGVTTKAMDADVKLRKGFEKLKQTGREVVGAGKAVASFPKHVLASIKDTIHKLDEADDKKRIAYMTEPGFRKKIFKNLRLAITYGTVISNKITLLPVVLLCRHWSKQKDRRVRNELMSSLDAEMKVCDEKINDASAAGDNQEKYRLIRIREKLERERMRVELNSKYI